MLKRHSSYAITFLTAAFGSFHATNGYSAEPPNIQHLPKINVLFQGAEPRAPLRFQLETGRPVDTRYDISMGMKSSMGASRMALPGTSLTAVTEVQSVSPDQIAAVLTRVLTFKVGNMELLRSNGTETQEPDQQFQWSYRISDRGIIEQSSFQVPRGLDSATRQQLAQVRSGLQDSMVTFPEEKIGKGGKWEVVYPEAESGGIRVQKTVTYTLDNKDDSTVALGVTVRQKAPNQKVSNLPGMPPGMSATLESLDVRATGQMEVDLNNLASNGGVTGKSTQSVSITPSAELGGAPINVTVEIDLRTRFSSNSDNGISGDLTGAGVGATTPAPIDLSAFINTQFSDMIRSEGEPFKFPSTLTSPDGVGFKVSGLVQFAGLAANSAASGLPDRISGIKIDRKCDRLHFLHAAGPGGRPEEGARIGSYIIKFTNGESLELPIVYGDDLRSWWSFPGESAQAAIAKVSWSTESSGTPVRLFVRVWENPTPQLKIESVDVVAGMARAGLFLAGITAD